MTSLAQFFVLAILLAQEPEEPEQPAPAAPPKKATIASPLEEQEWADVPYSFDVILRDDIDRRLTRTMPEIFREARGIDIQKESFGLESISMRGLSGSRTLFLIDGIRLNNTAFRDQSDAHATTVDPYLFGRVEVQRGAGGVLYGDGALGGVASARTREPERFPETFEVRMRSFYRYSTAENSHIAREEMSAYSSGVALMAGLAFRNFDDVAGGRVMGEMADTRYKGLDGDVKVVLRLDDSRRIVFAVQSDRQYDVPITHRTVDAKPWHGTIAGTDLKDNLKQDRDLVYLQFRWQDMASFLDEMEVSLSYHRQQETLTRIDAAETEISRQAEVNTGGFFVNVAKRTPIGLFTAGGEFYADVVASDGLDRTLAGTETQYTRGEVADDSVHDLAGLYVQDQVDLGDRLALTLGGRVLWSRLRAGEVDATAFGGPAVADFEKTSDTVLGSARLLYRATDTINLFGGVSQGYRAPNLEDTTAVRTVLSGRRLFPNPAIKPERTLDFEVGTRGHTETFSAEALFFYSALNEFITLRSEPSLGPDAFVKDNFAHGHIYGVELYGEYRLATTWALWADFSSSVGELISTVAGVSERHPLSRMNPVTAHLGMRYAPKGETYFVEGVLTTTRTQQRFSPTDLLDAELMPPSGTASWSSVTLRGGLEVLTNVRATFSVENVFDRDYRVHGSGLNEPGTNVLFGFELKM